MVLGYVSLHLAPHQQFWAPFEQEMWGLLQVQRAKNKQLGRIPNVMHTDHANISRIEGLPLERVDAKHFRWLAELLEGGNKLLYRPGVSALHKGPDGISRNPEGRDFLVLARKSDWDGYRAKIRGIQQAIESGENLSLIHI